MKDTNTAEVRVGNLTKYFSVKGNNTDSNYELYVQIINELTDELRLMGKDDLLKNVKV